MFSTIIPSYDFHDLTAIHVREAMNADTIPDEIIVVNDGGAPDLLDKLKALPKKCRLVYARIEQDIPWNYPGACNLGAWLSRGDLLFFEDNDNIPTRSFYTQALKYMEDNPDIGRITARGRSVISLDDILTKPVEGWKEINSIGPNQGTSCIRREVYLKVKGQDERFAGEYGWMYYDWKRKLLTRAGIKFGSIGMYYYTDGQSKLSRHMSKRNQSLLRLNSRVGAVQAPSGILNFTYEHQVL